MATPHVTGAIAILKAKLPNATADQILAAMQSSGISTTYTGWTWSTPLLDVNAAVDALGHAPAPSGVMLANLFSGANSTANLYLRLMNNDATIGHATITILQNSTPVNTLGTYNVTVPVNAALQISMKDIETAIGYSGSATSIFTGYIKADFKGFVQNVLYNPAAQALTNVTDCASLLTDDKRALGNVHTSLFSANYPGTIYINNTGSSDAKATLDMYEALTGTWLGSATTSTAVAAYTNTSINVVQWLDFVNFKPTTSQFHVVFKLRSGFSGFLQYLVSNVGSKVITDMTQKCAL